MKKFSHLLMAALLSSFIIACDDDSVPVIGDDEDPVANFTSPTQAELDAGFAPGASFVLTGTVSDNRDLETVSLSLTAPGATTPIFTEVWDDDNNDFDDETLTLNETFTVPATAEPGTYVLRLMAMDDAGNELLRTWDIMVMAPNARFNVTVPESTPLDAQIFVVGTFTPDGWEFDDSDETFMLTRNDDGTFSGEFMLPEGQTQEFKFRIKSDDPANPWLYVEKDENCAELAENRTVIGAADMEVFDMTVANWNALGVCGE